MEKSLLTPSAEVDQINTDFGKPSWFSFARIWPSKMRLFVLRWWMRTALIISLSFLTYDFGINNRLHKFTTSIECVERLNNNDLVDKKGQKQSTSYQAGARLGEYTAIFVLNWATILAIALIVSVLLKLQYKHFFEPLFESGKAGRVTYFFLFGLGWLLLVFVFSVLLTGHGRESGWHWSLANGFTLLNLGYCFYFSWSDGRKRQALLLQQKTQAELDALKAQVNPHFLFNTLNNLYGTALAEDSPRTAESIHQLSGIVRYVMEEANSARTDVQRELRFIDDYVELQRMRIPRLDNIRILVDTFWDEQPAEVMPLLLNPLIENAFKYGISIQYPCFVEIRLRIEDGLLTFSTRNSIVPRTQLERSTGLGLKNVQKRLALAYPGRHEFAVSEADGVFIVSLTIKL
jgi:hypothetical protein